MDILKTIKGGMLKGKFKYFFFVLLLLVLPLSAWAEDSEINRQCRVDYCGYYLGGTGIIQLGGEG
jgi:hypothetical protein